MNPRHRDHDELLIVRLASGDTDAVARTAAERQLSACEDCQVLLSDLQAIRSLTSPTALRVPPRPRSFRLSPDELERLGGSPWGRWLAGFGTPRFDMVRPLATVVAGVGLAVLVLGSINPRAAIPLAFGPEAGGTPASEQAEPTAAPQPSAGVPAPGNDQFGGSSSGTSRQGGKSTEPPGVEAPGGGGPAPLPLVPAGAAILASGLAVVILNTTARRAAGR